MTEPTASAPNSINADSAVKSKRLLIILVSVGGVLLLSVVALTFLLIGQNAGGPTLLAGNSEPTSTESQSTSPTGTPEAGQPVEEEPAQDSSARLTSFTAPTEVECDFGDEDNQPLKPEIQVSWSSANAVEAWYSPSAGDAKDDNYMQIPLSGTQDDLTDEHLFPCGHDNELTLTITLVGADGEHVSKQWTVVNVGDQ